MTKRAISDCWEMDCAGEAERLKLSKPENGGVLSQVITNEGEEPNFGSLEASCIHHIFSYLNYDKVAQLRHVCKTFDAVSKMVLTKGHKEIKKRLKREMEKTEESRPVPSLLRYSFQRFHFLEDIFDALRDCAATYKFFLEEDYYFVAGKVLEDVHRLLEDYNSHVTLPFTKGNLCLQRPHPLLGPFIQLAHRACHHFENVVAPNVLGKPDFYDFWSSVDHKKRKKRKLASDRHSEAEKMKRKIEKQERRVWIEEQTNRQFCDVILELNKRMMNLNGEMLVMDQKLEQLTKWAKNGSIESNCSFVDSAVSPHRTIQLESSRGSDRKRPNLGTLPSDCLQRILCYFSFEKVSHLRRVCKHFDETCKQVLNEGFEKIKEEVKYRDDYEEACCTRQAFFWTMTNMADAYLFKDLKILIMFCENTYKCNLDKKYYFSAGKVLDRFDQILKEFIDIDGLDITYCERPNPYIFPLIALAHKAINHFQNIIVPKYHRRKRHQKYTQNFLTFGNATEVKDKFEKQQLLKIVERKKMINEQEERMKKVNEKYRKSIKIICKLKKSVHFLEQGVLEKRKRISECQNLFAAKVDHTDKCTVLYNKSIKS